MNLRRCASIVLPLLSLQAAASADTVSYLWTFDDVPATAVAATEGGAVSHPGALTSLTATLGTGPGAITVTVTRVGGGRFDVIDNYAQYVSYTNPSSPSFVAANQPGKAAPGDNTTLDPNGRWGARSLDPFYINPGTATAANRDPAFIFTFSQPIQTFSILLGDYGDSSPEAGQFVGDTDRITLTAYSGAAATGSTLATTPTTTMPPGHLAGLATPFAQQRVTLTSPTAFTSVMVTAGLTTSYDDMSVYLDRLFISTAISTLPSDVDSQFNPGDSTSFSQAQPVPEPATLSLAALLAAALLHRRR